MQQRNEKSKTTKQKQTLEGTTSHMSSNISTATIFAVSTAIWLKKCLWPTAKGTVKNTRLQDSLLYLTGGEQYQFEIDAGVHLTSCAWWDSGWRFTFRDVEVVCSREQSLTHVLWRAECWNQTGIASYSSLIKSAVLYTEDNLAASHCGSAPGKLCRWRCDGDAWRKAGDKHAPLVLPGSRSDQAVWKKKCSQVFRGEKTQWFKASEAGSQWDTAREAEMGWRKRRGE